MRKIKVGGGGEAEDVQLCQLQRTPPKNNFVLSLFCLSCEILRLGTIQE